jgi:hypothetical protein
VFPLRSDLSPNLSSSSSSSSSTFCFTLLKEYSVAPQVCWFHFHECQHTSLHQMVSVAY